MEVLQTEEYENELRYSPSGKYTTKGPNIKDMETKIKYETVKSGKIMNAKIKMFLKGTSCCKPVT